MGAFVITLREGFEAALVVGLLLAFLNKTGQSRYAGAVWAGVAAAAVLGLVLGAALFLSGSSLEGDSEVLFEATAMIFAAAVVTWMVFWMRRQAATMGSNLRQQVSDSLSHGGWFSIAAIAFVGAGREGIETALFLFASVEDDGVGIAVAGGIAGLIVAIGLGVLFYRGAIRLNLRKFFTVTSVLVIGFAAYLIYGALHELGELAGSELLEAAAPLAAAAYGFGFAVLYISDYRKSKVRRLEQQEPGV